MAKLGLSYVMIAQRTSQGVYANGFQCGHAVNTTITPAYNEASNYGDNMEVDTAREFKNAAVAATATNLPLVAKSTMFGHTINTSTNEETDNSNDTPNDVGYGFVSKEVNDGVTSYVGCVVLKAKFVEAEDAYETKGDSLSFKNPTINGTATPESNGDWRKFKTFGTQAEAYAWVANILNFSDTCLVPTPSVSGGSYDASQSVTLTCGTEGATIKYTTDGTTPSDTNGTEYNSAITIAASTGLRAVAIKSGLNTSAVMVAEYLIS